MDNVRFSALFSWLGLAVVVLTAWGCATTTDVQTLQARLNTVEQQNRTLEATIGELRQELAAYKEQRNDIRELFAGQDAEFFGLKSQVGELQGSIEEAEYRLRQEIASAKAALDRVKQSTEKNTSTIAFHDTRLSRLETYMGLEPSDKFKARAEAQYPEKNDFDSLTEEELYNVAKQLFDDGDYDSAIQGFQMFLEKFKNSDKADNARFWIGEIYFAEKWYEKAILEYEKVIKNFPDGNKVPGAYLKQGIAFSKLGENANARLILKELIQKYPKSNEAEIARQKIAEIE